MKGKKVFSSIVLILTLLISIYFVVFGVFALLGEMGMNINSEALAKLYESYVGTLMLFAIFCVAKLNIPSNSEFMGYVINYLMPILYLVTFIFALILLIKVLRNRACKKTAIFTLVISILTFVVGAFYFLGAFIYASGLASADIGKIITSQYAILVALVFAILCMFSGIILINYEGNGEAKVQANINGAQVQQNPEGERSFVNSFENQNNMNAQNGAQPNAQNDQVTGAVMWQAMNNGQTPATPANPTTTPNQPANPWGAQPTENAWGTSPTSTTFETTGANGSPASSPSFSADVQPSSYSPSFTQSTQPAPDQTQSTFAQPDATLLNQMHHLERRQLHHHLGLNLKQDQILKAQHLALQQAAQHLELQVSLVVMLQLKLQLIAQHLVQMLLQVQLQANTYQQMKLLMQMEILQTQTKIMVLTTERNFN